MEQKKSLNIGISSMGCWLFLNGDMKNPIRGFADANCDVFTGLQKIEKAGEYEGEIAMNPVYVEYSPTHVVTIRKGWDETVPEEVYGKIIPKAGNSPFFKLNKS